MILFHALSMSFAIVKTTNNIDCGRLRTMLTAGGTAVRQRNTNV